MKVESVTFKIGPGEHAPSVPAFVSTPRRGYGPVVVILHDKPGLTTFEKQMASLLAEEGYIAVAPEYGIGNGLDDLVKAALKVDGASGNKAGLIAHGMGAELALNGLSNLPPVYGGLSHAIACVIIYHDPTSIRSDITDDVPIIVHMSSEALPVAKTFPNNFEAYSYDGTKPKFIDPDNENHDKAATSMAYSRSLAALRRTLGPTYDLSSIWEEHCRFEFDSRDVGATMETMVDEPYVNHIPTMTGGLGRAQLTRFYKYHFINSNPPDMRLTVLSRTVGTDRVVDEMLVSFTHTTAIDWMLPGIEPTGKRVEIPLVVVVNVRGDKICREHIYWDQASVLVQIGLLDPKLGLPIAGVETARKFADPQSVSSNVLMSKEWATSEGKPV